MGSDRAKSIQSCWELSYRREMASKRIFDISPLVSVRTAVFPGDVPFRRKVSLDFQTGSHLLLSSIESTLHLGAHADAPNHYHPQGIGIDQVAIRPYLGRCQVLSVNVEPGKRIGVADLPEKEKTRIAAERFLIKTGSFSNSEIWSSEFNSLSPELIIFLAERGVCLVGIDTPSIDPAHSKELESHQTVYDYQLAVLEGLVLDSVPDGVYSLIALPLKIEGADASPVRAILLEFSSQLET